MNRFSPESLFTQGELLASLKVVAEFPSILSLAGQGLRNFLLLLKAVELHLSQDRFSVSTFSIAFIRFGVLKFLHFISIKPGQLPYH